MADTWADCVRVCVCEAPESPQEQTIRVLQSPIKNSKTLARYPDLAHSSEERTLTASNRSALVHLALLLGSNNQIQAVKHLVCKVSNGNAPTPVLTASPACISGRASCLPLLAVCEEGKIHLRHISSTFIRGVGVMTMTEFAVLQHLFWQIWPEWGLAWIKNSAFLRLSTYFWLHRLIQKLSKNCPCLI